MKIVLSLLLVALFSGVSFAHCIWVDVPNQVEIGANIVFNAFYANVDDPIAQRDMEDLELSVRLPDGEIQDVNMEQKRYLLSDCKRIWSKR